MGLNFPMELGILTTDSSVPGVTGDLEKGLSFTTATGTNIPISISAGETQNLYFIAPVGEDEIERVFAIPANQATVNYGFFSTSSTGMRVRARFFQIDSSGTELLDSGFRNWYNVPAGNVGASGGFSSQPRMEFWPWDANQRLVFHIQLENTNGSGTITSDLDADASGPLFGTHVRFNNVEIRAPFLESTPEFPSHSIRPGVVSTSLSTSYSASHKPTFAEQNHRAYINNGWNTLRRWDGIESSLRTAGIAGPSRVADSWAPATGGGGLAVAAGDCTVGAHIFRYRYLDSTTGYVSNPSAEFEYVIESGSEELTFSISTTGTGNIIRSTDAKVDKIVIEMTVVGGAGVQEYFLAVEVANSASTAVVDISDAQLETQFLPWDGLKHEPPPVAKYVVSHAERLWLFGQVVHDTGNCDPTNASANVGEGTTDPDWNTEALGASAGDSDIPWLFQVVGDTSVYEVSHYDSGTPQLVLKENYGGSTDTDASYKIFSRANAIWISQPGFPEAFAPLEFLRGPHGESAGDLTAGIGLGDSMVFFTDNTMVNLSWRLGPLVDPVFIPITSKAGALNQRVVVKHGTGVYSMDRRGWWRWGGAQPALISKALVDVRDTIDWDYADCFHAVYLPEEEAIRWFYVASGDTTPKSYVQFDLMSQTWSKGSYSQGIESSRVVPTSEGIRPMAGDSNGFAWFVDGGVADGVDSSMTHYTVDGTRSVTTTTIPVTGTALTSNPGAYAHHPASGETRLITANSSNELTVEAFTSAPSDGDTIWIGVIPSKLKTKLFAAPRAAGKQRTRRLWVEYVPTSAARTLQVRIYEDRSTTAKTWRGSTTAATEDGVTHPGVNAEYPASDWLLDMSHSDGNLGINVGSEFKRYFEIELEILEPADIQIEGIETDGDVRVEDQT